MPKDEIAKVGQRLDVRRRTTKARIDNDRRRSRVDTARKLIFEHGMAVDSATLDDLLDEQSLVPIEVCQPAQRCLLLIPIQNAFSKRLSHLLFDFFKILVVDLLHEFEIGVWKATFIHMLRILQAHDAKLLAELNRRYVSISQT